MSDHAASRFKTLQWLPVSFGVRAKFLSMSYKTLHGMASTLSLPLLYLSDIISIIVFFLLNPPHPPAFSLPQILQVHLHCRAFPRAIPYVWFAFPSYLQAPFLTSFRFSLKSSPSSYLRWVIIFLSQYPLYPFPALFSYCNSSIFHILYIFCMYFMSCMRLKDFVSFFWLLVPNI